MGILGWITNLGMAGGAVAAPPTHGRCTYCGKQFRVGTPPAQATSYFFSSASFPRGSYTNAETIILALETILTCPFDERGQGHSPSGADLRRGDDRATAGDVPSLPGGPLSRPVGGQS